VVKKMFKLKIDTGNEAFSPDATYEVARILKVASEKLEEGFSDGTLYDSNGNKVGEFSLTTR